MEKRETTKRRLHLLPQFAEPRPLGAKTFILVGFALGLLTAAATFGGLGQ